MYCHMDSNHFKEITINIQTADPADNYHLKTSFTGLLLTDVLCVFSENRSQGVDDLPVMQTEQDDMPPTIPAPVCADHTGKGVPYSTTSALKKARYRMRKCFLKAGKMSSLKKVGLTGPKTTRATMTPRRSKRTSTSS